MRSILKNTFFRLLLLFPQRMSGRASILMYHSVSDRSEFFCVTPERFYAQMQYLHKSGRAVISLAELLTRMKRNELKGGEVVITFDDGYRDNYTTAFPVLKEFGFPATIFVTTGLVGKKDERGMEMLTIEEIKELHDSGLVDIAPHSVMHKKLAKLQRTEMKKEITDSKQYIEGLLGKTCDLFAYPYGNYNSETISVVKESGFQAAFTVEEGTVCFGDDVFSLHRNSIDCTTTEVQLIGKISRTVDYYHQLRHS